MKRRDPIIEELHRVREDIGKAHDFDVRRRSRVGSGSESRTLPRPPQSTASLAAYANPNRTNLLGYNFDDKTTDAAHALQGDDDRRLRVVARRPASGDHARSADGGSRALQRPALEQSPT